MPPVPQLEPRLSSALQFFPWPPGDPAPEIWRLIFELDRRVQVQAVKVVLDTQIAVAQAHVQGLQQIQKVIAGAKLG
jgi:hypothetical protein